MTLSIQEKSSYLTEFGVDLWFPRVKLNNSPLPQSFIETKRPPVTDDKPLVPENAETAALQTEPPVSDLKLERPAETLYEPAVSQPVMQPASVADDRPIHFALNLYVINDCLVISSLSSDFQLHDVPAKKLMCAVLKTMIRESQNLRHDHLISWPFFASPNSNQGIHSAKQYVNGVIEHLIESHSIKRLVVFGGVLPKLNAWQKAAGDLFEVPYLVLPSLYKMLAEPALKKKAWQAIQKSSFLAND